MSIRPDGSAGGDQFDPEQRDPEAPAPDLIEQTQLADPHQEAEQGSADVPPAPRARPDEADEYDVIEQSISVPYEDDYR